MRAFSFAEPVAKAFQNKCLENNLLINATDDYTVRIVPPLIISAANIEQAHDRMTAALAQVREMSGHRPSNASTSSS